MKNFTQRFLDGEQVQSRVLGFQEWMDVTNPTFEPDQEYRIKPKQFKFEVENEVTADSLLNDASKLLTERGKDYDKPEGERSMARIVAAFNAITGKEMTEVEGWEFMECVKAVRTHTGKTYHEDSMIDKISYAALKAEAGIKSNLTKAINGK